MYSSLFSSVTWISPPPSLSSWVEISPRISLSTAKNISKPHSSMSLSLKRENAQVWHHYSFFALDCFVMRLCDMTNLKSLEAKLSNSRKLYSHFVNSQKMIFKGILIVFQVSKALTVKHYFITHYSNKYNANLVSFIFLFKKDLLC